MRKTVLLLLCSLAVASTACRLEEVESKTRVGPEFRHSGSSRTDETRWTAQQGFDFKWDNDVTTGLTYRRRDTNDGDGGNDNGVWFDVSVPIWKAEKKPDAVEARIAELERRVAQLERSLAEKEFGNAQ